MGLLSLGLFTFGFGKSKANSHLCNNTYCGRALCERSVHGTKSNLAKSKYNTAILLEGESPRKWTFSSFLSSCSGKHNQYTDV